jgi:ribokinase
MVGCLGGDPEGRWLRDRVLAEGVDLSAVATVAEAPTGAAFILVAQGESTIVISAGANGLLEASYVEAQPVIANADALLCQLEVPLGAVQAAVRAARGLVVLNPAPAQLLPRAILDDVDVLVPNRHELAAITGSEPTADLAGIIDCARSIKVRKAVVVTLGDQGALAVWEGNAVRIPAVPSVVVDATAAGDSFCAGLVDGLLRGMQLLQAAEWASSVAAITVSRHGAIDSLPFRHEVVALTAGDAP